MIKKEIFSIIMPAYHSGTTIFDSIMSVLNQTFSDFVLYVIYDISDDDTLKVINSFKDERIKLLYSTSNQGVAHARNRGISAAEGKYIAFLDSDDLWLPTKLEKQLSILKNDYDVVCSNYFTFYENNIILNERISPQCIHYQDMLKSNFIGNLTGVYNAEKIGKVFQRLIAREDYVMWLDILKMAGAAFCIQEPLAQYRISKQSLSANKLKAIRSQWNTYRQVLQFSFSKSCILFGYYMLNAIKKRVLGRNIIRKSG